MINEFVKRSLTNYKTQRRYKCLIACTYIYGYNIIVESILASTVTLDKARLRIDNFESSHRVYELCLYCSKVCTTQKRSTGALLRLHIESCLSN